jgi:uncharacterized repeat protein (TIGR01451 family)
MNHVRGVLIGLAALAIATVAAAQRAAPALPLATELSLARIVVRDDGKEAQTPATQVRPGDTLQYTALYRNQGKTTLHDVVASLPVPQGMQLVPTQPDGLQASTDGKTFARLPLTRRVQQADGRWQDVPVPLAEIRYVRWPARALAAGEQFNASLRVQVVAAGS